VGLFCVVTCVELTPVIYHIVRLAIECLRETISNSVSGNGYTGLLCKVISIVFSLYWFSHRLFIRTHVVLFLC